MTGMSTDCSMGRESSAMSGNCWTWSSAESTHHDGQTMVPAGSAVVMTCSDLPSGTYMHEAGFQTWKPASDLHRSGVGDTGFEPVTSSV